MSVPNDLASARPNDAEPFRGKPSDVLAGITDPGEGHSAWGKRRPDTLMAVTS